VNAPTKDFRLDDRYTKKTGDVLLTGIQALVRLPMEQMQRDRQKGLQTATFISGYRGSPLGGYDLELTRQKKQLLDLNITFQPAINEELGATAVWGSQQVNLYEGAKYDGVCGIWYGKSPGVDRSTDAFRHGNAAGSAPHGGVLVVAGDDHGCKSSTYPGQSEFAFVDMHMPVLNPSSVQEVLDYGLYGLEMSRHCGAWVAMITLAENMDSREIVDIDPNRIAITHPAPPPEDVHIRLGDTPNDQERRLWELKRPAALAFARANAINKVVVESPAPVHGIVTTGKAHRDLVQALFNLGLDEDDLKAKGISIYKVGMSYPLDVPAIEDFARGLDSILVIEEKRSLIEVQLKEELYNTLVSERNFPIILGKKSRNNKPLLPDYGELNPSIIAQALARSFPVLSGLEDAGTVLDACADRLDLEEKRNAYFCSGCPHNTSTKVPEGSRALAGIGCHYLAKTMDRQTETFSQMGGEGVPWIGQAPFTDTPHVFANLGDGTYFHSGILAIRAAVAAKVNITYKILFNETVAMTGGQAIDGELSAKNIAEQLMAEGVEAVYWVLDDLNKYGAKVPAPPGVIVRQRGDLEGVQKEARSTPGVTCIIYDQACATELRRKRKRGLAEPKNKRVLINHLVCEGCGDCSTQSNCLSVEPLETPFGVKRQINQTSCNMDLSCVNGFCPSFVQVENATLKKPQADESLDFTKLEAALDTPTMPQLEEPWNILVTGIGGTGVVTIGALMSVAAFIDGKAVTTLDQTGLAQKGGAVHSHIRLAKKADALHCVRISNASTHALIACDTVSAGDWDTSVSKLSPTITQAVINTHAAPTAQFVLGKTDRARGGADVVSQACQESTRVNASDLGLKALGNTLTANTIMLGAAWQKGLVPLSLDAIMHAIELNGVAVAENKKAFTIGRASAADIGLGLANTPEPSTPDELGLEGAIAARRAHLAKHSNEAYAQRYEALVSLAQQREHAVHPQADALTAAVSYSAFRLMAIKDEYEVARLYTTGSFRRTLLDTFNTGHKAKILLAPPLLSPKDKATGLPKKRAFGLWILSAMTLLKRMKFLRGTALDPFGHTHERRLERALRDYYLAQQHVLLECLSPENYAAVLELAKAPQEIKGFGHVKDPRMKAYIEGQERLLAALPAADRKGLPRPPAFL
jgi:indolepyruvate ferredoxin oxidoreductase